MNRAMSAVIVKEFRENLRWAGLIAALTLTLLIVGLADQFGIGVSLVGRTFLQLCLVMYPGAGLTLALLQCFQDSGRGRWQFVRHRPISPTSVFAGKVMVGLGLYLLATLIPLALVTLWVKTPGHVPGPFAWDMVEPALAHLLSGTMWYAAGLLVATRRARWWVSRLVPLGGAVLGTFAYNLIAMTLAQSVAITFGFVALLLLAGWGVFVADGSTERAPLWTRSITSAALAIGWLMVIGVVTAAVGQAVDALTPRQQSSYKLLHLTPAGDVQTYTFDRARLAKVQDPSGHELPLTSAEKEIRERLPSVEIYLPSNLRSDPPLIGRAQRAGFLHSESHVEWLSGGTGNWFYVNSRRTVENYDQRDRRFRGTVGPHGFADAASPPEPFPPDRLNADVVGFHSPLLVYPTVAYQLALSNNDVRKIFEASPSDPILTASTSGVFEVSDKTAAPTPSLTVLVTRSRLNVITANKKPVSVPFELGQIDNGLTVQLLSGGSFAVASGFSSVAGIYPAACSIYDPDGKFVRRVDIPAEPQVEEPFRTRWLEEVTSISLVPQLVMLVFFAVKGRAGFGFPWQAVTIFTGSVFVYVTAGYFILRPRHVSTGRMILWLIVVACLGLTGLLVMVSMVEKPASVACRACGRRRLVTEDRCSKCEAAAPGPAMQGIKIFAS